MPKRPDRNKQTVRPGSKPRTAGDLISARLPALVQRALSATDESVWHVAVMKALGPDLANKVNRCTLDSGTLTVVAESSAWAARMRFRLAEAEPELRAVSPGYRELVVRVRPRRTTAELAAPGKPAR
jgi:predicted nucleic acid-binding Zn ribbon protein